MDKRQQQVADSLVRVQAFLDAHPATGTLAYTHAREMLDGVVERLRSFAGAQLSGRNQSRAEVRRQRDQLALLLDQHIRPIVTIARAQIEPTSDVGLPAGLKMPRLPLGPTKMLAVCDSMLEAARAQQAVFVASGLPADFLAQFTAARNVLVQLMAGRATQVTTQVAARTGLKVQLTRGRRAVERLDALVRASYRRDETVLSAWAQAKRVRLLPGGGAGRSGESVEAEAAVLPVAVSALPGAVPAAA